ncbi:hypothetical protein TNCV_2940871 [Trichonephila clavipes]|nr:hypothetical protein TNCV_2940871 [Trichonephila clavipes]
MRGIRLVSQNSNVCSGKDFLLSAFSKIFKVTFLDMLTRWLTPQLQEDSDNFSLQLDGASLNCSVMSEIISMIIYLPNGLDEARTSTGNLPDDHQEVLTE